VWRHVSENCNIQASKKLALFLKFLFISGLFNDTVDGLDCISADGLTIIE